MKVLVVEDDASSRDYLKNVIEYNGHVITTAADGFSGLDIYKDFQPDVTIVDIKMPGMDGLEVLSSIRKHNNGSIVIMATAYGSEEYALQSLRLGANDYLKKPIRNDDLVKLLHKYDTRPDTSPVPLISGKQTHRRDEFCLHGQDELGTHKPVDSNKGLADKDRSYNNYFSEVAVCPYCESGMGIRINRKSWMRLIPGSKLFKCAGCARQYFKIFDWEKIISHLARL